jgi:uncharacterized membrane protein
VTFQNEILLTVQLTRNQAVLFIIIAIAILLRIPALTTHSLWWDELQSMRTADPSNSFAEMLRICRQSADPAPRTFYFILNVWFHIFGYNDFTARLLMALSGIAAIPVMYLLGKKLQDKNTGLIAALLTAVNYFHIFHSLEVRFYGLLFLFSALSYLFFLRSLDRNSYFNLIFYTVCTLFLMLLHYFGILVFAAQGITWLYLRRASIFRNFSMNQRLLLAFLFIAAAYLPFTGGLFQTLRTETSALSGNPGNYFFINYFKVYFGFSGITVIPAAAAFLFFIIVAFLFPENKIKSATALILCIWMLLPPAMAYARTLFSSPTMGERYFIIILPGLIIALALGIHSIVSNSVRFAFILLYATGCVISLSGEHRFYTSPAKDDFRGVVKYIWEKESTAPFYVLSDKNWHFKYYFDQYKLQPVYLEHQQYSDARFYLSKELYTDEKLLNDTALSGFWLISAHFSNLNNMDALAGTLLSSEHFYLKDSFKSKDAFAKLLERKDIHDKFFNYPISFPPDKMIDLDNENVLAIWDGEYVSNPIPLPRGKYTIGIKSKGTKAAGVYPHINVFVNDNKIGDFSGTSRYELINFTFEIEKDSAFIRLQLENDLYIPDNNEDRNLFVRSIIISKTK